MDKSIDKSISDDKKISIAIMSSFFILTMQYLILIYFNLIGTNIGSKVQLVSKILVGILYLLALPSVLKRNKIKFIGVYFISTFIFIVNYAIFRENWPYLQTVIFPFFFTALPSFIYAYSINDWDILMDIMEKTSKIVFIIGTIIAILVFTGNVSVGAYSMSLSYYMLLPTILLMNKFLDKISFKNGVLLLIALLIILSLGSRGAIMCVGVFTMFKLMKSFRKINYPKILLHLIIFTIMIVAFLFIDEILEYIYNFLLGFGIRSRSISLFLREDVYLSGRDEIYEGVINETLNNPILGIGLAGDRRIIGGGYAHNIFIEILANFGIVMGSFMAIILIYIIIKSLIEKRSKNYNMIIIWISTGFIHLFVSSSYLIDFKFWILLGLILSLGKKEVEINK